jgi:integrase
MTASRKVGPVRLRAHKRHGAETGKWFVDVPASLTASGKRVRQLFENRREASEVAKRLRRELEAQALGLANRRQSGLTFARASELWEVNETSRVDTLKKRAISLETDKARLKSALALFGATDIGLITEAQLTAYQRARLKAGRSPETVNSDVKAVFKVLKWALKNKRIRELPAIEPVPTEPRDFEAPDEAEVIKLIEALPARLRLLVWFLAETGCRAGEAYHLRWEDVDLDAGTIMIRSKEGWTPKTRSSRRRVFVMGSLLQALRAAPRDGACVFPGRNPDRPITNIKKAFETARKRAGLEPKPGFLRLTPHSLRKAYATRCSMGGVPERILQANLGHAPGSKVTNRYYVFASELARRQAALPLPVPPRLASALAISGNSQSEASGKHRRAAS